MKTKHFNGALLSTLMIVSLIAPAISMISLLSVGTVSAQPPAYENIVRAKEWAYNVPGVDYVSPWQIYDNDPATPYENRPPIMVAKRYDNGAVVAAQVIETCRDGRWNSLYMPTTYRGGLAYLFDAIFEWMSPGPFDNRNNVLWYEGHEVYNTIDTGTVQCQQLEDNLEAAQWGPGGNNAYTLVGDSSPRITSSLLTPYDIVVIPQLQDGPDEWCGDPNLLWDNEVEALENFVKAGGGLLVLEGSDSFAHCFCKVQNKILKKFDMKLYFQSDIVYDETDQWGNNRWQPIAKVENTGIGSIGDKYIAKMGTDNLGLYQIGSMAPKYPAQPTVTPEPAQPMFYEGIPGGKLIYRLTIMNQGLENDNIDLTKGDAAGWTLVLAENYFENVMPDESRTTELTVTIPTSATFGFIDNITVQVTSRREPAKKDNKKLTAIASMRVRPVTEDTELSENNPTLPSGTDFYFWVSSTKEPEYTVRRYHTNRRAWLKFDLRAIPSTIPPGNWDNENLQARLYVYCWGIHGAYGKNVRCYGVDYDDWWEENLTWNTQSGLPGTYLDTTKITDTYAWYSWDVTSFIRSQLGKKTLQGDNFATLYLRAETENLTYPENFAYEFYSKERLEDNWYVPYLVIGYDVYTWITPDYGHAMLGGTAYFNVKMMNQGSFTDNYLLENTDDKGWTITHPLKVEGVLPNEIRKVDLSVRIPSGATVCTDDNVRVTVRSEKYPDNAWDNDRCFAHADNKKISAKEDSTVKGQAQLENSVWGRSGTIWTGRENRIFAGPDFYYYPPTPERGWLKFDLRGIPSIDNIVRANLNLYCYQVVGGADVQVRGADDGWSEDNINWLNQPSAGSILDSRVVGAENMWYSWDVTDFVQGQYQGDNMASFCLIDVGENINPVHLARFESSNYGFESENENVRPYLEILSAAPENEVRVYVNPIFQGGLAVSTENYIVTIVNKGTDNDTYTLENVDNLGWQLSLDNASLFVPAGENRQTTLHVTIPSGSVGTFDNITVKATGTGVSDNTMCYAHRGKALIPGLGAIVKDALYHAQVDVNFLVSSEIVVVFKDYSIPPVKENENVIWTGIGPKIAENTLAVGHPPGGSLPVPKAVKNVEIVLRGSSERVLASFTVRQAHLRQRSKDILKYWGSYPAYQPAFRAEMKDILKIWGSAPP